MAEELYLCAVVGHTRPRQAAIVVQLNPNLQGWEAGTKLGLQPAWLQGDWLERMCVNGGLAISESTPIHVHLCRNFDGLSARIRRRGAVSAAQSYRLSRTGDSALIASVRAHRPGHIPKHRSEMMISGRQSAILSMGGPCARTAGTGVRVGQLRAQQGRPCPGD